VNRAGLFRTRGEHAHSPVTYIELFFDLVFVFAITQLSHFLLADVSAAGALQTLILFFAIWWAWIYTSWTTNWLDPDRALVRLMLLAVMLGGLGMAVALPTAFGDGGVLFAAAYCTIQFGRTAFVAWASASDHPGRARNFMRILFYFALALPLWIAGALADSGMRMALWAAALAIEYAGPFFFFHTPVLGRSTLADWDISGAHMAERCALFIIIALGEAILVTGATFADLPHDAPTSAVFMLSFLGSATMWWIYFDVGAKRGTEMIAHAENAGQIARNAYTYLHMPIVAGIVVTAVADEKMLASPTAVASPALLVTAIGGPLLFLAGNQMFKWITSGARFPPLSHSVGIVLLALFAGLAVWLSWSAVAIGAATTGALVFTARWEWLSLNGGWQKFAPWLERYFTRLPR
jgi:low temperature requirement protein LtrA